jgi:hypothetical protein
MMGRKSKKQLEEEAKKDFYNRIQYMIIRYTGECNSKKYKDYKFIDLAKMYEKDLKEIEFNLYGNLVDIAEAYRNMEIGYPKLKKRQVEFRYLRRFLKSVSHIENIGKKEGFIKAIEYFDKIFHKASCYSYKIIEYENRKNKFVFKNNAPITKTKALNFLKAYVRKNYNNFKCSDLLGILNIFEEQSK